MTETIDHQAARLIREDERRKCAGLIEDWLERIATVNAMADRSPHNAALQAMRKPQEQIDLLGTAVVMIRLRQDDGL